VSSTLAISLRTPGLFEVAADTKKQKKQEKQELQERQYNLEF